MQRDGFSFRSDIFPSLDWFLEVPDLTLLCLQIARRWPLIGKVHVGACSIISLSLQLTVSEVHHPKVSCINLDNIVN